VVEDLHDDLFEPLVGGGPDGVSELLRVNHHLVELVVFFGGLLELLDFELVEYLELAISIDVDQSILGFD